MSAHVVPKAPSFSTDDEEEKTTIESGGWEEEASTTVEQGDAADKLRALALAAPPAGRSNTGITSTTGTGSVVTGSGVTDEPTVDDQRASAALAMMPPPTTARLVITQGGDSGRSLEVRPGKTYTVGRGIDNDLVLTDITASRKHFDIRLENGTWILADRGSGNGTAINNRIEDAPFLLANGDRIEVGNTAFRFDVVTAAIPLPGLPREAPPIARDAGARASRAQPIAGDDAEDSRELATPEVAQVPPMPRDAALARELAGPAAASSDDGIPQVAGGIPHQVPGSAQTFDGTVDDDLEMSTVSGKPVPGVEPPRPAVTASRPKTLPPPSPPRARTQTGRPPMAFTGPRSQQMAVPQQQPVIPPSALAAVMAPPMSSMHTVPALSQAATALPLPQMANRPPLVPTMLDAPAHAPAHAHAPLGSPHALPLGSPLGSPAVPHAPLQVTLPGQGPPVGMRGPRLPFGYPGQDLSPQRVSASMRAPLHVGPGHPGRDATSTAQVHPMSYSGGQAAVAPRMQPRRFALPPISRRIKLAAGGTALTVFAAIATIAIIRSASGDAPAGADVALDGRGSAPPRVTVAAVREPAPATKAKRPVVTPIAPTPTPTPVAAAAAPRTPPAPQAVAAPPPIAAPQGTAAPPAPTTSSSPPAPTSTTAATSAAAPSAQPAQPAQPTQPAQPIAAVRPAPPAPPPSAASPPAPAATPTAPPTPAATPTAPPAPAVAHRDPDPQPERPTRSDPPLERPTRSDPAPSSRTAAAAKSAKRADTHPPPHKVAEASPPPARPAKHSGRSLQDIKAEATGLYRSKNFSGAALAINSSLTGVGADDTKDLKSLSAMYAQFGKVYAVGMAPGTKPTEAYQALQRALQYDRELGGAYVPEMREKLASVAPRAATSYMAARSFEQALAAVRTAEQSGSTSDNNKIVRASLEDHARELLGDARAEATSNPDDAKQKAHQAQAIVEPKSPVYAQAQKLLNSL